MAGQRWSLAVWLLLSAAFSLDEQVAGGHSSLLGLVQEGEGGVVDDAIAAGVETAMAAVRAKLKVSPEGRMARRGRERRATRAADGGSRVVNSMEKQRHMSADCKEATRLKVLGLGSMAVEYAKRCAQEAAAAVTEEAASGPSDHGESSMHRNTASRSMVDSRAQTPRAAHPPPKPDRLASQPASAGATSSRLEEQMRAMQQQIRNMRLERPSPTRVPLRESLDADGDTQQTVKADLVGREAKVIEQERRAERIQQRAVAAQAEVETERQAAKQMLDEAERKGSEIKEQAAMALRHARDQATKEAIDAHKKAARTTQEAAKEAHDIQQHSSQQVSALEKSALDHAKELVDQSKSQAHDLMNKAKQEEAQAKTRLDAERSKEAQFRVQEEKEESKLAARKRKLEATEQAASAKMAGAERLRTRLAKQQQDLSVAQRESGTKQRQILSDAKRQARATLKAAQQKLAKVAAEEEGEELKIQEERSKTQAQTARMIEQDRQQAADRIRQKQRRADRDADKIRRDAIAEATQRKQRVEQLVSKTETKLDREEAQVEREKAAAAISLSKERAGADLEMERARKAEKVREDKDSEHAKSELSRARSRAESRLRDIRGQVEKIEARRDRELTRARREAEEHAKRITSDAREWAKRERARELRGEARLHKVAVAEAAQLTGKGNLTAGQMVAAAHEQAVRIEQEAQRQAEASKDKEREREAVVRQQSDKAIAIMQKAAKSKVAAQLAAAQRLIRTKTDQIKSKYAHTEATIKQSLQRAKLQADATQHHARALEAQAEKHRAAVMASLGEESEEVMRKANVSAEALVANATRAALDKERAAQAEISEQEAGARAEEANADGMMSRAKTLVNASRTRLGEELKAQKAQLLEVRKVLREKLTRAAAKVSLAEKNVRVAHEAETRVERHAKQVAGSVITQAKRVASSLLQKERASESAMLTKFERDLTRQQEQASARQRNGTMQLNQLRSQRRKLALEVTELKRQRAGRLEALTQMVQANASTAVSAQAKREAQRTASLIHQAELRANRTVGMVLQKERRNEDKALGEATAQAELKFEQKEKQLMVLTKAIQERAARQIANASGDAKQADEARSSQVHLVHELQRKLRAEDQEIQSTRHTTQTLRQQLGQAQAQVKKDADQIASIRKARDLAAVELRHQRDRAGQWKHKATSLESMAASAEAHRRSVLSPGAKAVDAELASDASLISHLTDLKPKDRAQMAVKTGLAKRHPPNTTLAKRDAHLTEDRDEIRRDDAAILESRTEEVSVNRHLRQAHRQAASWKNLIQAVPPGPQRTNFVLKLRASEAREREQAAKLRALEGKIQASEHELRQATRDAAHATAPSGSLDHGGANPTAREKAAAEKLEAARKVPPAGARQVSRDMINADMDKLGALKVEEGAARDEMLRLHKAEEVWKGFVTATRGVTRKQFSGKLRKTRRREEEIQGAIREYGKSIAEERAKIEEETNERDLLAAQQNVHHPQT